MLPRTWWGCGLPGRFIRCGGLELTSRALHDLGRAHLERRLVPSAWLDDAMADGAIADEDFVRYVWRQVQRDDHLMRTASGALRERTWPPLH